MNTPLKAAIDAGADLLHVVYVEPQVAQIPFNRFQGTLEAIIRTLSVANAANIAADLETARRVNSSLAVIENLARGQPPAALEVRDFVRAAGQVYNQEVKSKRPRQLTIHRYHPRDVLGGPYGLVNFDISAIRQMIERGYADTRRHDCVARGCIVPDLR